VAVRLKLKDELKKQIYLPIDYIEVMRNEGNGMGGKTRIKNKKSVSRKDFN
jgi:hypothetical protein